MAGVFLSICLLTASPGAAGTDAVLRWNENAGRAATAVCLTPEGNPLAEARMYAMVQIAVHDAVNAIRRRSRPYAYEVEASGGTSSSAAVAAAARDVLVAVIGQLQESSDCIQRGLTTVQADYAAALHELPDNQPKARGIAVGQAAASAILALRATMDRTQCWPTPCTRRERNPASTNSLPGPPSRSRHAAARSRHSCCASLRSSAPPRRFQSTAAITRRTSTR